MEPFTCPHNMGVEYDKPECDRCGWNPKVAAARLEKIMRKEKLYRIPFTGYCEVWAKDPEEAADMAEDIEKQFFAHYEYGEPTCESKEEKDE